MKTIIRTSLCILSLSLLAIACTKEDRSVPLQILLTDNPVPYDSVNIHIRLIRVKMHSDSAGWTNIQSKDTTVNLLDLQNGHTMVIASDSIPEGVLKEVRFILGDSNYIVENGVRHELQTPSAEDAGLEL